MMFTAKGWFRNQNIDNINSHCRNRTHDLTKSNGTNFFGLLHNHSIFKVLLSNWQIQQHMAPIIDNLESSVSTKFHVNQKMLKFQEPTAFQPKSHHFHHLNSTSISTLLEAVALTVNLNVHFIVTTTLLHDIKLKMTSPSMDANAPCNSYLL